MRTKKIDNDFENSKKFYENSKKVSRLEKKPLVQKKNSKEKEKKRINAAKTKKETNEIMQKISQKFGVAVPESTKNSLQSLNSGPNFQSELEVERGIWRIHGI